MAFIFIANWKMMMPSTKAINFCKDNRSALVDLGLSSHLVICPSFPVLEPLIKIFEKTKVDIGAQNCSRYKDGAYTGEVSSQTLAEIGCHYCIVGHSERRRYFGETNEDIAQKVKQLIACNIEPIICIGETKQEYDNQETFRVLTEQLVPVCRVINQSRPVIVAYEPVWAIGTGVIPDKDYLITIFSWLVDYMQQQGMSSNIRFLYGGSVNEHNVVLIKKISFVSGFLVGGASTDFQMLQKIVLLGR